MPCMMEPFLSVISNKDLLYVSISSLGMMFSKPESPSKHVARMSFDVGAVTNQRVPENNAALMPIQLDAV